MTSYQIVIIEGEYSSGGGKIYEGTENEVVIQESIFTKKGVDRVMKFAFGQPK